MFLISVFKNMTYKRHRTEKTRKKKQLCMLDNTPLVSHTTGNAVKEYAYKDFNLSRSWYSW